MNRWLRIWRRLTSMSPGRRLEVYHLLAGLLQTRRQLPAALETVASAAEARGARGEGAVVREWNRALAGSRFAEEMARWAPRSEAAVFSAYGRGEVEIADLFAGAARVCELKTMLVEAIRSAVSTPAIYAVAVLGMMWAAGGYMLPELVAVSQSHRWAWYTQMMVGLCTGLYEQTIPVAVSIAGIVALVWVATLRWTGRGRRFLDRFPPFSLYRTVTGCSFLLSVMELVGSGVDLTDDMLERLRDSSSPYGASRIEAIRGRMTDGLAFGKSMEEAGTGFPDPVLIAVAQALDGTESWHVELAGFVDRWVRRSERIMEQRMAKVRLGVLTAVAATLAGLVGAMFDLASKIG